MENEYGIKYLVKVVESIDSRTTRIEASLANISTLVNKFVQHNSPAGVDTHNTKSTQDISDVLSTIRAGLFNVVNSDDENTNTELSSLISGLKDAKDRLNDISSRISEADISSDVSETNSG